MPNNTRSKIKIERKKAEDHIIKAIAALDFIFEQYDESNIGSDEILLTIHNCTMLSMETDNIPPIEIYRVLLRENKVPYLGKYDQHLFHLATIYLSLSAVNDSLKEFAIWETKN